MPILSTLLFISSGAALGACLRWGLSVVLNPLFAAFSFGTLIANYLGCFIIGALFCVILVFSANFGRVEIVLGNRLSWQFNHLFLIFH